MADTLLRIENLEKSFGTSHVLKGVSLTVNEGEFVTLLGASGCGKTTTLRILAGLTEPDSGSVYLGGEDITRLPPEKRNVNTVFQNYALFPHMNVEKNIAYGLRIKGVKRKEIKEKVKEMLALVRLSGREKRMPDQLSGGQRQRVAIARAVVLQPKLLLLDEPLGALDLKLRREMQTELKEIQKALGISFIYVTHDQEEALNMSDRIAVMKDGVIEQLGTPEEIYEHPKTRYIAQFIGEAVLFDGTVSGKSIVFSEGEMQSSSDQMKDGEKLTVSVHPERIRFSAYPALGFSMPATVVCHRYAGSLIRTELRFLKNGRTVSAVSAAIMSDLPSPGTQVNVYWDERHHALLREENA